MSEVYSLRMVIDLSPELEAKATEAAAALGYESTEVYVSACVTSWLAEDDLSPEERQSISAMIDEGWEEAERGELLTAEEVKSSLSEMKRSGSSGDEKPHDLSAYATGTAGYFPYLGTYRSR